MHICVFITAPRSVHDCIDACPPAEVVVRLTPVAGGLDGAKRNEQWVCSAVFQLGKHGCPRRGRSRPRLDGWASQTMDSDVSCRSKCWRIALVVLCCTKVPKKIEHAHTCVKRCTICTTGCGSTTQRNGTHTQRRMC